MFHTRTRIDESYLIGDIVDNDDAMCTSIVAARDRSKSFLTGSVPLEHMCEEMREDSSWNEDSFTICNLIVFPSRSIVRIF